MKSRSLRGLLNAGEKRGIILDDGRINQGYIVKEFYVWATSQAGQRDPAMNLSLDDDDINSWRADDSRQIGWAGMSTTAGQRIMSFSLVDPNHLVVRDLWVNNWSADAGNYLIVIEPVTITDDEAVLAIIKERSQDE